MLPNHTITKQLFMRILILFALLFLQIKSFSQNGTISASPPGIKFLKTVTVEEMHYHEIQQGVSPQGLSPVDLPFLEQKRTISRERQTIWETGDYAFRTEILNPEEVDADWPVKIARYESDSMGVRAFKTDSMLYKSWPADSTYTATYQMAKNMFNSQTQMVSDHFPMPDSATLGAMQSAGGVNIDYLSNGNLRIKSANAEGVYAPSQNSIITSTYEGEYLVEKRMQRFEQIQGYYFLAFERIERPVIRPSGLCMREVIRRYYRNYEIGLATERSNTMQQEQNNVLAVWPNPTFNVLNYQTNDDVLTNSSVRVSNVAGVSVYTREPPTSENRGIYWVHGLGGGPESWAEARTASQLGTTGFQARKVIGTLPTYVQTSLNAAGLDLQELVKSNPLVTDPSLNFL